MAYTLLAGLKVLELGRLISAPVLWQAAGRHGGRSHEDRAPLQR